MNQSTEAEVKPRRSLLKALWMSVLGLWSSTKLEARKRVEEPDIFTIVGRLCLQKSFRDSFFRKDMLPDDVLNMAEVAGMIKHSELKGFLKKVLEKNPKLQEAKPNKPGGGTDPAPAPNFSTQAAPADTSTLNPIEAACAAVQKEFSYISGWPNVGPNVPCKPWPCG